MAGSKLIAGLDEVGLGSLAGPLVIVVTAFPQEMESIPGVKDSKKLTAEQRQALIPSIVEAASYIGVGFAPVSMINAIGPARAWQKAADMALATLKPAHVGMFIIDGQVHVQSWPDRQDVLPKADADYWQVSAASIFAKVSRDTDMIDLDRHYPMYGWKENMGYGTPAHVRALLAHGPSPHHRRKYTESAMATLLAKIDSSQKAQGLP